MNLRVAVCGPAGDAQFAIGLRRLGAEVVRVGNDEPIPSPRPEIFIDAPRNGGYTAEYWARPCEESEERERGDFTWPEFHAIIGGQPLDLIFVREGAWSFIGPRVAPYEKTPVVLFAADPSRGPEKHIRDAVKSGAVKILVQAPYFVPAYNNRRAIQKCVEFYRRIKPKAPACPPPVFVAEYRFPFSYHDKIFQPAWNTPKIYDIVFRGTVIPRAGSTFATPFGEAWHRSRLLELLVRDPDFKVSVGDGLQPAGWAALAHQGKLLLQYDGGTFPFFTGLTRRTFEILGSGEFLFMNRSLTSEQVFKDGVHYGGFQTFYHPLHHHFEFFDYSVFKTEAMRWLEDDTGRDRVRHAGYEEVRARHKPEDRALEILRSVGLAP